MKLRLKQSLLGTAFEPLAKTLAHRVQPLLRTAHEPHFAMMYFENFFLMRALAQVVEPDMNCIDIGAHIGSVLNEFHRLAPDGAHLAVEPTPKKAAWLARKFPDAEILQCAVAEQPGVMKFRENLTRPAFSQLHRNGAPVSAVDGDRIREYEVEVRTLDDIALPRPRTGLLKVDVEGAELPVFRGGAGLIARDRPVLIFECGTDPVEEGADADSSALWRLITEDYDYDVFCIRRFPYNRVALTHDSFVYCRTFPPIACNFIALPRG